MEIIFVLLIGALAGLALQYALPAQNTRGVALLAGFGASAGLLVWTILDLATLGDNALVMWSSTVIAAVGVPLVAGIVLIKKRTAADEAARVAARI